MVSIDVFRRGTGKVWHYRFQVAGKRIMRTTRLTDKAEAQKVAARVYAEAVARANGGELLPTLSELLTQWMEMRGPTASAAHRRAVDVIRRHHLYSLGGMAISKITTDDVERVRNQYLETHAPATANQWLRVINLAMNWAVRRELLLRLPYKVAMLKVQKRPRPIIPLDMVMDWLDKIDGSTKRSPSVSVALRLIFGAGLREGEAAGARWEWLDWERRTYTPGVTKGREASPIPLPDWLIDYLAPRRQARGLIAPRPDGTQLPAGYARRAITAANAACGIDGITPHRLRGSFATLLSESGANIQAIQAVMRHKSPLTTMTYLERNLATVSTAQAKIAEKAGLLRIKNGSALESEPYTT
jgi:integrase/recombinase XerC